MKSYVLVDTKGEVKAIREFLEPPKLSNPGWLEVIDTKDRLDATYYNSEKEFSIRGTEYITSYTNTPKYSIDQMVELVLKKIDDSCNKIREDYNFGYLYDRKVREARIIIGLVNKKQKVDPDMFPLIKASIGIHAVDLYTSALIVDSKYKIAEEILNITELHRMSIKHITRNSSDYSRLVDIANNINFNLSSDKLNILLDELISISKLSTSLLEVF